MPISLLIALPLLGFTINGLYHLVQVSRKKPVRAAVVNVFGVGLPLAAFALALAASLPLFRGSDAALKEQIFTWFTVGNLRVEVGLIFDRLTALMSLIVTGVGSLIHLYSVGYMKGDPGYAKYFSYLNLFLASMLILVLADNLLFLFLGWEGVGLCSYLLVGFWFEDMAKAVAGKKAFVVNRIGDFGFLIGIFAVIALLLPLADGAQSILNFEYMQQHASRLGVAANVITMFLFIGAIGKSAQIPLYVWLPDAMAGPTPVSALIHAATMVTAGAYMIARLNFLYELAPWTLGLVAVVGASTALFAAVIALTQNDIKKVLAYSTVSQLGYMFLALGVGAYAAGIFHLLTHAFFKACLFLGAGSVIHALSGEQDIRNMGGLKRALPITAWTFLVATLAIAGIPPLAGFFSKDEILWQAYHRGHTALWAVAFVAAFLTSFYMFRLCIQTFFGTSRISEHAKAHLHESELNMSSVLVILAFLSLVGGFVGVPQVLGGDNHIQHWLGLGPEPIGHGGAQLHGLELTLMAASIGMAILGAVAATVIYLKYPEAPMRWSRKFHRLYQVIVNKFYVDEIYNALIVQPIRITSDKFLDKVVDQKFIDDTLVNGSGRLAAWTGGMVSRLQGGLVNRYVFYFFIALTCFAVFMVIF